MVKGIIIQTPKGYLWRGTNNDLSKEVKLKFAKASKLGRLLKQSKEIIRKVPKGMRVSKIENNNPTIGKIFIEFKKK